MSAVEPSLGSARSDLVALTRARVMRGLADLLEEGEKDLTFETVATASGVPLRTLFRHFPSKEALFQSFWTWVSDALRPPAPPRDATELHAYISGLFASFDANAALVRAMLHNPHGRATRLAHRQARQAKIEASLAEAGRGLNTEAARDLAAAVATLCSATTWEALQDECGLSGPEAARAVQRAVAALVAAAEAKKDKGSPK